MLTPIDKEPLLRKLRKILEHARRGSPGEKEVAQRLLDGLCSKYGIDPETVFREPEVEFAIKYRNNGELTVLTQIICVTLKTDSVNYAPRAKIITGKCSPLLKAEILTRCEIYLRDYRRQFTEKKKEFSLFPRAFIASNDIYNSDADPDDSKPLTDAEIEEIRKVVLMSRGIKRSEINPLLDGGKND